MKKFFTLTLALLASFSLWADPTYKSTWSDLTRVGETDYYYTMLNSTNYASYISAGWMSYTGASTGSATLKIDPATDEEITGSSATYGKVKNDGSRYMEFYVTGITSIKFYFANTGSSDRKIQYKLNGGNATDLVTVVQKTSNSESITLSKNTNNTIRIFSPDNDVFLCAIKVVAPPACTEVTSEPTFGAGSTSLVITNPAVAASTSLTFTKGTQNLSNPTYVVTKNDEATTDAIVEGTTFSATAAGEYVVTATQAEYEYSGGTYCEVIKQVTITVTSEVPVSSVTVAGATSAYVGAELTYTATAANATAYEWYLDGVKQGSDSTKFIYTAVKGSHSIVCKARNTFNLDPEWISSEAKELIVTNPSGTLIAYNAKTSSSSINEDFIVAASASIVIGGTGHQKSQSNAKLNSGGYYSLTLAQGAFLAGDTVRIVVTPEKDSKDVYQIPATLIISSKQDNSDILGEATGLSVSGTRTADTTVNVILTKGALTIWLSRDGTISGQNPIVKSISVIRPKEVKSVTETLSNVKIDGEAISSANLTTLLADESLDIAESYLNAPEVKFYKTIRTTYEDNTHSDKLDSIVVTSTTEAGKWEAQATINEVEYTITMAKTPSFTVTYKLGSRTLGSELVIANGNPAEYEDYQVIDNNGLSTFVGWYNNADLAEEHKVANMSAEVISAAAIYYAKFNIKYASSINIEQWILDNGAGKGSSTKTDALIAEMNSHNYSTNIEWSNTSKEEIELDSLDDGKTSRNEPYLGLKVKKSGKLINFRLKEGDYVKVKFGQVSTTPKVAINGGDYTDMTITDNVYTYNATGEDLVSIYIDVAQKAVIYKQIMINEDIQDVTLPDTPTAIDNTEDGVKAVKFFENGQLFIRRGDKIFDTKGQVVK